MIRVIRRVYVGHEYYSGFHEKKRKTRAIRYSAMTFVINIELLVENVDGNNSYHAECAVTCPCVCKELDGEIHGRDVISEREQYCQR